MPRAFTIRPFGKKKDSAGKEVDFEQIDRELIRPALAAAGLAGGTTGEIVESGNVREDMFALILEADLVLCDITVHNANVFYELGIRHALRKKRSVLIKGGPVVDSPPFDILTDRYHPYDVDSPGKSVEPLAEMIRETLASERETDSPIFKMLPSLREAEPSAVAQVVPTDLIEEIGRGTAAQSAGWLRLLASEVGGFRFEWPALRLIGQSQWEVGDYDGARATWERVVGNDPGDVAANLALTNLYERQYRRSKKPEHLQASEQAVARVLSRGDWITAAQRAEALALTGRNYKTVWRLGFETLHDLVARREKASSRALRDAYEAYRNAYLADLNHFWPGLAALQLGFIGLDLATDDPWQDAFDSAAQAKSYAEKLAGEMQELRAIIPMAANAALERLPPGHKDRVWAELSPADIKFLVEDRAQRVIRAYLDAVPRSNFFAWDAARGQLELFASLGVRAELAREVIKAVEAGLERPERVEAHVIVFVGHQVDEPGRAERRFPPAREAKAHELIGTHLAQVKEGTLKVHVLASAAPGSDIICHEICGGLGIPSTLCLPMPNDEYARLIFGNGLDPWRSRYLRLLDKLPVLQLSERPGLPRWLGGNPNVDPWERGNRWVLEMARTSGAKQVTLLALWDGRENSGLPGGTGHMVRIARHSGTVDVVIIDAAQLLAE